MEYNEDPNQELGRDQRRLVDQYELKGKKIILIKIKMLILVRNSVYLTQLNTNVN